MKTELSKIAQDLEQGTITEKEAQNLLLGLLCVMHRSFGMVRWHGNLHEDVACVSIEKAKEYVEKYNKLSGKESCYVDEDVWLLLNEA